MSTEENKLVGRRFFGEILNNGNLVKCQLELARCLTKESYPEEPLASRNILP
jgi:hypothetical protein